MFVDVVGCESDDGSIEFGEGVFVFVELVEVVGVLLSFIVLVMLLVMDWE